MRIKTSITLSEETVEALDELTGPDGNRSRTIERAVIDYVERRRRELRDVKDLEILNREADELNREIGDVLSYQAEM